MSHNFCLNDLTTSTGDGSGAEHVCNGDRAGTLGAWEAESTNSQPVSFTVSFHRSFAVGRVVVHTPGASLGDFNAEALTPSGWVTLFGVFDNEDETVERTFEARLASAVRVNVTRHGGDKAEVAELEVYPR